MKFFLSFIFLALFLTRHVYSIQCQMTYYVEQNTCSGNDDTRRGIENIFKTEVDVCCRCPAGKYCPGDGEKYKCDNGCFCRAEISYQSCQESCTTGSYCMDPKGDAQNTNCNPTAEDGHYCYNPTSRVCCPEGFYCYGTRAWRETDPCDNGYYCPPCSWKKDMYECPAGYWCEYGLRRSCNWHFKIGTWTDAGVQWTNATCKDCPENFACLGPGVKTECPPHWFCPAGTYGVNEEAVYCCSGHGACDNIDRFACTCYDNYGGDQCDEYTCHGISWESNTVCSGNGNCTGHDECKCKVGWGGPKCKWKTCNGVPQNLPQVCSWRGKCTDFDSCECQFGWEGPDCEDINALEQAEISRVQWTVTGIVLGSIGFFCCVLLLVAGGGALIAWEIYRNVKKPKEPISKELKEDLAIEDPEKPTPEPDEKPKKKIPSCASCQKKGGYLVKKDGVHYCKPCNQKLKEEKKVQPVMQQVQKPDPEPQPKPKKVVPSCADCQKKGGYLVKFQGKHYCKPCYDGYYK